MECHNAWGPDHLDDEIQAARPLIFLMCPSCRGPPGLVNLSVWNIILGGQHTILNGYNPFGIFGVGIHCGLRIGQDAIRNSWIVIQIVYLDKAPFLPSMAALQLTI